MRRNTIRYLLTMLVLAACPVVYGQSSDSGILDDKQFARMRALLQEKRADIIREELRLTDAESAAFWPVYDKYHSEIMAVRDRQAELFGRFFKARQADAIDDEFARELIGDHFDLKSDLLKVQKRYLRQFRKVLPALKEIETNWSAGSTLVVCRTYRAVGNASQAEVGLIVGPAPYPDSDLGNPLDRGSGRFDNHRMPHRVK